jgi:hypothetical protein
MSRLPPAGAGAVAGGGGSEGGSRSAGAEQLSDVGVGDVERGGDGGGVRGCGSRRGGVMTARDLWRRIAGVAADDVTGAVQTLSASGGSGAAGGGGGGGQVRGGGKRVGGGGGEGNEGYTVLSGGLVPSGMYLEHNQFISFHSEFGTCKRELMWHSPPFFRAY